MRRVFQWSHCAIMLAMLLPLSLNAADIIPFESEWLWLHPQGFDEDPALDDPDFDSTWFTANNTVQWEGPDQAPFAYGNDDGTHINAFLPDNGDFVREANTFLTQPPSEDRYTAYFAHSFTTTTATNGLLAMEILTDDGAQFYLDGQPLASFNCCAGEPDIPVFLDNASAVGNENEYTLLTLEGVTIEPGDHLLAVSIHQANQTSSDLGFSLRLQDNYVPPPPPVEIMPEGEVWRFFKGRSEPSGGSLDWTTRGFDDSDWDSGEEGFGYETGGGLVFDLVQTEIDDMPDDGFNDDPYSTLYIRNGFTVENPNQFVGLELNIDYDDGFVAYINGTEVTRSTGEVGTPFAFDDLSPTGHESSNADGSDPDTFSIDLTQFPGLLNPGSDNIIAIQGLNTTLNSSDFALARISLGGILPTGPIGEPGDFDGNGVLDADDIDALAAAIRAGDNSSIYDVNGDAIVDVEDHRVWVEELRSTWFGDANLDGEFSSNDFVLIFTSGEFEDGIPGNSTWADGDWNGDGEFSSSDFVSAFVSGGFEVGPRQVVADVPEPTALGLIGFALLAVALKNRRRS